MSNNYQSIYQCPVCCVPRCKEIVVDKETHMVREVVYECGTKLTITKKGHEYSGSWQQKCKEKVGGENEGR